MTTYSTVAPIGSTSYSNVEKISDQKNFQDGVVFEFQDGTTFQFNSSEGDYQTVSLPA